MIRIHFAGLTSAPPTVDLYQIVVDPAGIDQAVPWMRRYAQIASEAHRLFEPAPAEKADVFLYPYRYEPGERAEQVAAAARQQGVPIIFFSWGDDPTPPLMPSHGLLFRQSLFSDQRRPNEHVSPAFAEDVLTRTGGRVQERPWAAVPTVGFRGFVGTPLQRAAYALMNRRRKAQGLALRARLLRILAKSNRIRCAFSPQNHFSGQASPHAVETQWQQYVAELLASDYVLCVRGTGNYSYRLYETLSAGRIPIFVNTRCTLPFDQQIDWKRHCVWVEESDIERIADRTADFHAAHSDESFRALQRANRQLWEERLSPLGFYRTLLTGLTQSPAEQSGS
jgi:hypothetical protein